MASCELARGEAHRRERRGRSHRSARGRSRRGARAEKRRKPGDLEASSNLRDDPESEEAKEGREDSARDYAADFSIEGVGVPRLVGISLCLLSPLQRTFFSAVSWSAMCH